MKRIILLAATALIACGAVAQTNETYPSYVQVTGSAEREIEPDEFYLAVTINERDSKGKISIEQQQRDISSSRPPPSSAAPSATSCSAPSASACRAIITSAASALTAISSSSDKHRPRAPRIG